MKIEEKIEEIRRLVRKIDYYDDLIYMRDCDYWELSDAKRELWDLLQNL